MLQQNTPYRDLDLILSRMAGTSSGQTAMPMDAYRRGDDVWVHIDLPGVESDSIDISVERKVLTVSANRSWQREEGDQIYLSERSQGRFFRQVHLGDSLDPDGIDATFDQGVLTLRIPVSERSKPRKITIGDRQEAIDVESSSKTDSSS